MLLVLFVSGPASAARGSIILVSANQAQSPGNGGSLVPVISADGRFVAFASDATDLSDDNGDGFFNDDTNLVTDVFVRDLANKSTVRISRGTPTDLNFTGAEGNGASSSPSISDDGRYVAFVSAATNLDPDDPNLLVSVYVRDRDADNDGKFDERGRGNTRTILASVSSDGQNASADATEPAISGDGTTVAFTSSARNLVPEPNDPYTDVYVRMILAGGTVRVSITTSGKRGDKNSSQPALSRDGQFVVFTSSATNFSEATGTLPTDVADTNVARDIFVHDRNSDGTGGFDEENGTRTFRVSLGSIQSDGLPLQANGESFAPTMSPDGSLVAFTSRATNLVQDPSGQPIDTNSFDDVYLRDLTRRVTQLVSIDKDGKASDGASGSAKIICGPAVPTVPAVCDPVGAVVFYSAATDLVQGDVNGSADIFLRDLAAGATDIVSINDQGSQADGDSLEPGASADGALVAFTSDGTNLDPGDEREASNVFVRNRFSCAGRQEKGTVSTIVHEQVEPEAGPARGTMHDANCDVVAANGF